MKQPILYSSSGDLGDIVLGLPAIKYHGRGTLLIKASNFTRQRLTPDKFAPLVPLLELQPYIERVAPWAGEAVNFNFDDFRARMFPAVISRLPDAQRKSLTDWQLEALGVPLSAKNQRYIDVDEVWEVAPVVINRTLRYHNPEMPWSKIINHYGQNKCVFLGHFDEWESFCWSHGKIPYYPTKDYLEAARVIAGSKLFIGNQSCCHAIAEGMKHPIVLEVWPQGPNCLFHRKDVTHAWSRNVPLPEV